MVLREMQLFFYKNAGKMKSALKIIFAITYLLFPKIVESQTWLSQPDSLWRWMWKTDTAETLNRHAEVKIAQFVQQEHVFFLSHMYRKKYNIDSLLSDSIKQNLFLTNPFIAEYPNLLEYNYCPKFRIVNMKMQACYFTGCYLKNVYEVIKTDYFVRAANIHIGVLPDTISRPMYNMHIEGTSVTESDSHFAIYYEEGKPMRMLGGSAFLEGFPEPAASTGSEAKKLIAQILVRTRMVGRIPITPNNLESKLSLGIFVDNIDTIGSFSNGYMFFVPDLPGGILKNEGRYDLLTRPFVLFYFVPPNQTQLRVRYEAKLVIVVTPLYREYNYSISHSDHNNTKTILDERWADVDVFTIFFTNKLEKSYRNEKFGYLPGFYAYEVKQIFVNKPALPEDNFPRVRGINKEEFDRMKSKSYIKPVCYDGN